MRFLVLAVLCVCLAACGPSDGKHSESTGSTPADTEAAVLLHDVSGVWAASQGGLITIDYRDGELRLVIGDDPKFVKLGDVDLSQQTVNLLLKRAADGADIIWTLHRVWDQDKTSFHLVLILDDGSRDELSFVRKITADDINRLSNLYARASPPANIVNSGGQLSPLPGASPPTAPVNGATPNGGDGMIGGTNGGAAYTRSQFESWLSTNSNFHSGRQDVTHDETQLLFYNHNGSIAKATILYPANRSVELWTIAYEIPRPGMSEAGAKPGDVIFSGQSDPDTGSLSGTSYIFNRKCGKFSFEVHETNQQPGADSNLRVLGGNAPIVDNQTCQVAGYKEIGLDFEELFEGIVIQKKE